jgi:hypothetical protein
VRNDCQCGQPIGSTASLCTRCRRTLVIALVNVSAYWGDLDTVRARQTRYSQGGVRTTEDLPGMDMRFGTDGVGTRLIHDIRNTLVTWVRYVAEHVTEVEGPVCPVCAHHTCKAITKTRMPADTVPAMCAYLMRWSDWLRVSPGGPQALDEVTALERRAKWLVDRPADQWYAGPCNAVTRPPIHDGMTCPCVCHRSAYTLCDVVGGCGLNFTTGEGHCTEELYAKAGDATVTCRACRTEHKVAALRDSLLTMAENREASTTTISRAVAAWGDYDGTETALNARIRKWAERHQILPIRHEVINGQKRPLYRVGEVLDLLADDARRFQERSAAAEKRRERRAS